MDAPSSSGSKQIVYFGKNSVQFNTRNLDLSKNGTSRAFLCDLTERLIPVELYKSIFSYICDGWDESIIAMSRVNRYLYSLVEQFLGEFLNLFYSRNPLVPFKLNIAYFNVELDAAVIFYFYSLRHIRDHEIFKHFKQIFESYLCFYINLWLECGKNPIEHENEFEFVIGKENSIRLSKRRNASIFILSQFFKKYSSFRRIECNVASWDPGTDINQNSGILSGVRSTVGNWFSGSTEVNRDSVEIASSEQQCAKWSPVNFIGEYRLLERSFYLLDCFANIPGDIYSWMCNSFEYKKGSDYCYEFNIGDDVIKLDERSEASVIRLSQFFLRYFLSYKVTDNFLINDPNIKEVIDFFSRHQSNAEVNKVVIELAFHFCCQCYDKSRQRGGHFYPWALNNFVQSGLIERGSFPFLRNLAIASLKDDKSTSDFQKGAIRLLTTCLDGMPNLDGNDKKFLKSYLFEKLGNIDPPFTLMQLIYGLFRRQLIDIDAEEAEYLKKFILIQVSEDFCPCVELLWVLLDAKLVAFDLEEAGLIKKYFLKYVRKQLGCKLTDLFTALLASKLIVLNVDERNFIKESLIQQITDDASATPQCVKLLDQLLIMNLIEIVKDDGRRLKDYIIGELRFSKKTLWDDFIVWVNHLIFRQVIEVEAGDVVRFSDVNFSTQLTLFYNLLCTGLLKNEAGSNSQSFEDFVLVTLRSPEASWKTQLAVMDLFYQLLLLNYVERDSDKASCFRDLVIAKYTDQQGVSVVQDYIDVTFKQLKEVGLLEANTDGMKLFKDRMIANLKDPEYSFISQEGVFQCCFELVRDNLVEMSIEDLKFFKYYIFEKTKDSSFFSVPYFRRLVFSFLFMLLDKGFIGIEADETVDF